MAHRAAAKQPRVCHCGRTFSKAEHLARHERSHTKEKPFCCTMCNKAYSRQDSLLRHLRTHRSGTILREAAAATPTEGTVPAGNVLRVGINVDAEDDGISNFNDNANNTGVSDEAVAPPLNGCVPLSSNLNDFAAAVGSGLTDISTSISSTGLTEEFDGGSFLTSQPDQSWLLASDFDIDALDHSITAAIANWGCSNDTPNAWQDAMHTDAALILQQMNAESNAPVPPSAAVSVQQKWYTHVTPCASASARPPHAHQQEQVDEAYRCSLTNHLYYKMSDDALPSADFLNHCIGLYFSKFHPVFPIVHAASFRPSTENALILLSICSMGALLMGPGNGAAHGRKIFQRLNKAILATWERRINRSREEVLSLAQASIIGQTVGMMSGHPSDLYLAESFHGTVISWARRAGMFQLTNTHLNLGVADADSIDGVWGSWSHAEASVRIVLALHVHDALFSSIFHHEPLLRHDSSRLARCCSEDLFNVSTAEEWIRLVEGNGPEAAIYSGQLHNSRFRAYAVLAGILATINDARHSSHIFQRARELREVLAAWRKEYIGIEQSPSDDPQCLLVLWHEAYISLHVDLDVLERFIGRDGPAVAEQQVVAVRQWATSAEARLCVTHAMLIKNYLEGLPTGWEPALHVPRALFFAGIVIYAFIKASPTGEGFATPYFDTCTSVENSSSGGDWNLPTFYPRASKFSKIDTAVICSIVDLLQRQGHWNLSRKLGSILESLLNDMVQGSVWAP